MKKFTKGLWKKEEGFTLIELIIVIAILAIISAIAIPNILNAVDNTRKTADVSNAKIIADAAAQVRAKYEQFSASTYPVTDGLDCTTEVIAPPAATLPAAYTFSQALSVELNNAMPKPKYKGTTLVEDNFLLFILPNGTISVYVSPAATDTAAAASLVYPNPIAAYTNN